MNIINELANFRVFGNTPHKFAISQYMIKFGREAGESGLLAIKDILNRNFVQNGDVQSFANGIWGIGKELSNFAYKNPDYIGAFGAGVFGLYNLGKLIYKYGGTPKMSISQQINLGFAKNIKDIVDNPLYTLIGLGAAGFTYKRICDNFEQSSI